MKKKVIALIMLCLIVISALSASFIAFADDVSWEYDSASKTLTIYGSGDMDNFADEFSAPWFSHIQQIENVVISDGITSIGAYAFAGAKRLDNVSIAESVSAVNNYAFSSCSALENLYFSPSVISIADESFSYDGLTKKDNFVLECEPCSYALSYAFNNDIPFDCESVKCGDYTANVVVGGMIIYYPYTAKLNGTFRFSSTGNHDTYGYLYDSEHRQLISNDDATSSNTNFSLSYNLVKGETYYFAARIFNSSLKGSFGISLEAIDYTVSGGIYAMLNPQGDTSDILIDEALIDGVACNGEFSYHITQPKTITVSAGQVSLVKTFSADDGDEQDIAIQMCDVVDDGIVNGKDYVAMYHGNSKYLPLFPNFFDTAVAVE